MALRLEKRDLFGVRFYREKGGRAEFDEIETGNLIGAYKAGPGEMLGLGVSYSLHYQMGREDGDFDKARFCLKTAGEMLTRYAGPDAEELARDLYSESVGLVQA